MGTVPQNYYDFVVHYAPYFYVIPTIITADASSGQKNVSVADGTKFQTGYPVQIYDNVNSEWNTVASVNGNTVIMQNSLANTYKVIQGGTVESPESAYGQGVFPAAFAIDFLYQAYSSSQFTKNQVDILTKIRALADFVLTQQCTNTAKKAYGGFQNAQGSTQYWSADAGRCIPALLEAYSLTGTATYLAAAVLAGSTFLYNMQHNPSLLGVHDKYYGGFARYVDINDAWSELMDVENLYCLIGLSMLAQTYDVAHASVYTAMMADLAGFLRSGYEQFYLWFDPKPTGDGKWHRVGLGEIQIYDDPFSFALLGLFTYEGWSATAENVYKFLGSVQASAQYPAYNPAICWPGYIDVIQRFPACAYYDALTIGILGSIRAAHDKPAYSLSMQVLAEYSNEFLFWGPIFTDYSPITPQKAMANVTWLARFFLSYQEPQTDMTNMLATSGEDLQLYPVQEAADSVTWGEPLSIKGIVVQGATGEIVIEPGYLTENNITVHSFLPVRVHDKIRQRGVDYEVRTVQVFDFQGDPRYYKSVCRKLINQ
jgi:hypothetical protein